MLKSRYRKMESLKIMGKASKRVMGPNIEVLVWNVHKCKKKGWLEDFANLLREKDLVILQEAVLNSPFDIHFNKSLQHQWIMARSFRNTKTNIETGINTGSTVAAKEHCFLASSHSEPVSRTKKMLLATLYPLNTDHQSLLVVNAHLINFVSFEKYKTHLDQVFSTLRNHDGPILLAGDFNTWNRRRQKYFDEQSLSFALEEAQITRQRRFKHFYKHLDHIYSRGLEVVDAQVNTHIHSSDHYPICLSLRTLD